MDVVGYTLNRNAAETDGLKQQVVLLSSLSKELEEYFSIPAIGGRRWCEDRKR